MTRQLVSHDRDDEVNSNEVSSRHPEFVEPNWRKERARVPWQLRRLRILLVGIGIIAIAGLLVWLALCVRPPRSINLVLLGADYGENLLVPHNTYGWNVLEDFATLTNEPQLQTWGTRLIQLAHPPLELHSECHWKHSIQVASNHAEFVYVSAHGAVGKEGPYLLFADAHVPDARSSLLLIDLLDQLSQLPPNRQKVVVLDCAAMASQWSLGVLRNDFSRALENLESRIEAIPNLVVISSSGPDERSWSCGSWRQSVFGHYLLEGIRGGVDDTNHDGRIDLWDLYAGVCRETNSWVQANRAARQTPMILPRDKVGYDRARSIDIVPVPRSYRPPAPAAVADTEVPDEIVQVWETHQRLARQVPSPAAHTPIAWRRFRDLLIRYEELVVAGNRVDAAVVRRRMVASQAEIERDLVAGLSSIQNSLGMFDTLRGTSDAPSGLGRGDPDGNAKALETLWNAATGKQIKEWDKLCDAVANDPEVIQRLRMALQPLIIQRVSEAPAENFARGCDLIRILDDPLRPRPAESHFLIMLAADLPNTPWDDQRRDLVRLALDTRQQAERTTWNNRNPAYSHYGLVFPRIRKVVAAADRERRLGEDLLLSDACDYDRSKQYLRKASDLYGEAARYGAAFGRACENYEHAMAELPYYVHWTARKRSDFRDDRTAQKNRLDALERLCLDTHRLGMAIRGDTSQDTDAGDLRAIAVKSDEVADALTRFERSILEKWQLIASEDSPQAWCDIRNALRVPQEDSTLRLKILRRFLQTERRIAVNSTPGRSHASHITIELQTKRAKWAAQVEGRLALAMLGCETYELLKGDQQHSYDEILHALDVFGVEEKWWETVALAGRAVGDAWNHVAPATDKNSRSAENANQQEAAQDLASAESLSRLLPSYCELAVAKEPAWVAQRSRLKAMLQWQAERTCDDHWYADRPDVEPYYRTAAESFLNDATIMYVRWPIDQKLKQRITASGDLQFVVADGVDVSSRRRIEVPLRLKSGKGSEVPDGYPVVWFDVGDSLELIQPHATRTAWPWSMSENVHPLICDLVSKTLEDAETHPPPQPTVAKTELVLHGRFRGQRIEGVVPIRLHLAPNFTSIRYAPARKASVAVRADEPLHRTYGEGSGNIAIVLDCTGSMGPPADALFSPTTKYAEATAALGRVLGRLPQGTTVSLWVFGQALGPEKTVRDPEKTIRQILAPVTWNPTDPAQLPDLLSEISYPALEPWNESPIVRAILAAKNDLEKAEGFKTIVVLTDGIDNRVVGDNEINPEGKDVPTLLRDAFRDSGIELNIVGFRMSGREETQGWEQFQVVRSLFPPGEFCTVSESESLAESLDAALRQRLRYWIEKPNLQDLQGVPPRGLEVSRTGENNQWYPGSLAVGAYFLRVNADHRIDKGIALEDGDHLLARLVKKDGRFEFRRVAYGAEDFFWKPARSSEAWRATLLQNQRIGNGQLQMLMGLEPTGQPSSGVLSIVRPDRMWIEIQPSQGDSSPIRVAWNTCWGFPAATWRLNVPQWPLDDQKRPVGSEVKMWWSFKGGATPDAVLLRPGDFTSPEKLAGREVVIRGQKVVIESVGVEEHVVQTGPEQRQSKDCLVVRLRSCHDQTVWVQPWGTEAVGAEHRFYQDVGHYMGLFWPATKELVGDSLCRLELISLDTFKRSAEERGNTIQFDKLPPPDPNDIGPQSVDSTRPYTSDRGNQKQASEHARSTDQVYDTR